MADVDSGRDRRTIWLFPAVATPEAGVIRGRAFRSDPDRGRIRLLRNLRSIVAADELRHAEIDLGVLGRNARVRSDDEGFFVWELGPLAPWPLGTHEVVAGFPGHARVVARSRLSVVADDALSIVSDFDDTVAVSHVRNKPRMLFTALMRDESAHPAVPGMAALYRALARRPGRVFHYLSASPLGFFRRTSRFLERHGFPDGTLGLRHLGGESFRPLLFKPPRIAALALALPHHRFLLFGDSGEKDPEVYAAVRALLGDRVRGVFIRRVGADSHDAPRFDGTFLFDRPSEAAAECARMGLVDWQAVAEVATAERSTGGEGP